MNIFNKKKEAPKVENETKEYAEEKIYLGEVLIVVKIMSVIAKKVMAERKHPGG
jgi:hypothetical protein